MGKRHNRTLLIKIQFIKIFFYPVILFLNYIGVIDRLIAPINKFLKFLGIKKSVNSFFQYQDYCTLFKGTFRSTEPTQRKVLFLSFLGANSNFTLFNLMLAKFFYDAGLRPVFVICDSTVPICQKENIIKSRKFNPLFCYECYGGYKAIAEQTGLEIVPLSKLNNPSDKIDYEKSIREIENLTSIADCSNFAFKGIPLGVYTKKNVLRYFLKGSFTESVRELNIFKKILKSSITLHFLYKNLFNRNSRIYRAMIHNGTLAFESLFRYYCNSNNIPYLTYETYMGVDRVLYKKDDEVMRFNWDNEMRLFYEKNPVTSDMESKVSHFFSELKIGKHAYGILNKEQKKSDIDLYGRFVCAFSNLNFDTTVLDRNSIFKSMDDWLVSLINFWENNDTGLKLVIRIHPAEIKLRTGTKDFIGNKLRKIIKSTDKIFLVDSTQTINSYDLIDKMEYGLIYSSTIGLEIANTDKVCVVAGNPYFRRYPIVLAPEEKNEYFITISRLNSGENWFKPDRKMITRLTYFIFLERLKKLNGIKLFTLNAEPNCSCESAREIVEINYKFLEDIEAEFNQTTIRPASS